MKTIGLVGGASWVSSLDYYRLLNELVNRRLGGLNYARCILYSFNYADLTALNATRDWGTLLRYVTDASRKLIAAGAEGLMLCANTMHLVADDLERVIDVPLI